MKKSLQKILKNWPKIGQKYESKITKSSKNESKITKNGKNQTKTKQKYDKNRKKLSKI